MDKHNESSADTTSNSLPEIRNLKQEVLYEDDDYVIEPASELDDYAAGDVLAYMAENPQSTVKIESDYEDDDDDESYTSERGTRSWRKKRRRPVMHFTREQEAKMAALFEKHECLYNKQHPEFYRLDKDELFAEIGAGVDPPCTGDQVRTYYTSARTMYGKIRLKYADPTKKLTFKENFLYKHFNFLDEFIVHKTRGKAKMATQPILAPHEALGASSASRGDSTLQLAQVLPSPQQLPPPPQPLAQATWSPPSHTTASNPSSSQQVADPPRVSRHRSRAVAWNRSDEEEDEGCKEPPETRRRPQTRQSTASTPTIVSRDNSDVVAQILNRLQRLEEGSQTIAASAVEPHTAMVDSYAAYVATVMRQFRREDFTSFVTDLTPLLTKYLDRAQTQPQPDKKR